MKKQLRSLLYLMGVTLLGLVPNASAINFTLTSAGPANLGGVYTSPYIATIEGVGSGIKVFCDDFIDDVYIGETWTVQATTVSQLPWTGESSPVLFDTGDTASCAGLTGTAHSNCMEKAGNPGNQVYDYVTLAILAQQALLYNATSLNAELLSYAIWSVFHPSSPLSIPATCTFTAGVSCRTQVDNYVAAARALALGQDASNFANVTIYTSVPKTGAAVTVCPPGHVCNTPQEFVVVTMAEAPFPAILGFDLLAVAGLLFFVRRRSLGATL